MFISYLAIVLGCTSPKIYNKTDLGWNTTDTENLKTASIRCVVHYKKSPCLKIFTKIGYQDYTAICGKPSN